MAVGGSIFLGYSLVLEYLRHHDETNLRPKFLDHELACSLVGAVAAASYFGGSPRHMVTGAIAGAITIGWPLWWFWNLQTKPGYNKPAGVFYQNDATKDEIERITHQDQTEMLAAMMIQKPGYGMITGDGRHM